MSRVRPFFRSSLHPDDSHIRQVSCRGSSKTVIEIVLGVALIASSVLPAAPAFGADFPTVVANILNSQTDGRIASLDPATKQRMVTCVNGVLTGLPNGKKRFVLEGASLGDQEDRFGKVVKENRAEWEQKIASACGKIAMRGGGIGHQ